jgi:arginine decarboxylase
MGRTFDQSKTPYYDAVLNYIHKGRTAFHMPGHARGRIAPQEMIELLGEKIFQADLTEVEGLDYLHKPEGVVKEAQELAADAFGADHSFFLVNGSTVGVVAMILAAVKPGEKLIVQRNSHRSVIAGLTLGNVEPVFIQTRFHPEMGMMTGITPEDLKECIEKNPDVVAVLMTSPNYFGMAENTQELIRIARENNLTVLVDESHGVHIHFHPQLPTSAVDLGADMVTQSVHKTLPSLTQTSILHLNGDRIPRRRVQTLLAYLQTSSPSYLFMASLDVVRKQMALQGKELIDKAIQTADEARAEIKKFRHIYSFRDEVIGNYGICDFDPTKLTICVKNTGYTGFELEKLLNQDFNIEIELADLSNILCFITAGNTQDDITHLMEALSYYDQHIVPVQSRDITKLPRIPNLILTPTETFALEPVLMDFDVADGQIAFEVIAPYPPGIPYTCPGEIITQEVIDLVTELRSIGSVVQGVSIDNKVKVVKY